MSDPSLDIRDANLADLDRIVEIESGSFPDPYPRGLLKGLFYLPGGYVVAVTGGSVIGYAIGIMRWRSTGHIISVAVDRHARRKGAGEALMRALLERLGSLGANRVRLEVRESNAAAREMYKKLGFVEKEKIEGYYGDGESAMCMYLSETPDPRK